MLRRAKIILGTSEFTALYDKGYHTGCEIKASIRAGIDIMVAVPGVASSAPDEKYNMSHFTYDQINDTYTCPQNKITTTNGNPYQKNRNRNYYVVKHYKTNACPHCPARSLLMNIIDKTTFKKFLEELASLFSQISTAINAIIFKISPSFFKSISAE